MVFLPHWPKILEKRKINLGVDNILEVLNRLDNPQDKLAPVIHVAGTNGKGSTIAFLKSILMSAGYRVHSYTSPHLLNFNERISLNGKHISDDYLKLIMEEARITTADTNITFFEGTTIGAFLAFSKIETDFILLETGMGGRLDATNIVKEPLKTVITPISLDHTEFLGNDIRTIAGEKAGIMKKNSETIISLQHDIVHDVLENKANELGIESFAHSYDWNVEILDDNHMQYQSKDGYILTLPKPNLYGDHQIINAATAIATIKRMTDYTITDQNIIDGILNAKWPARLQKITKGPIAKSLPKDWQLWIDGAHNEAGASSLANVMDKDWQDKKTYFICGITKGRSIESILKYFKGKVDFICTIKVKTEPSAYPAKEIAHKAENLGFKAKAFDEIEDIIDFLTTNDSSPARIIGCGSLYLSSDILKLSKINIS